MRWRLRGRLAGRELRLLIGSKGAVVGSAGDCDHVIADPTVSRRHVRVQPAEDQLEFEDLGSRNGTWFEGARLAGVVRLSPGQKVRLGDVELAIEHVAEDDAVAVFGADPVREVPRDGRDAAPTMVAAAVVRFCLREFEPLLVRIAGAGSPDETAVLMTSTLVAAGLGCGAAITRERTTLACAGILEGEAVSAGLGPYRLRIHGVPADDRPGAESVARMLLAVLVLSDPAAPSAPAQPATSTAAEPPLTSSPALRDIYRDAARLAQSRLNVLVTGESGTGKELLARYLHEASGEPDDRFLVLNCAALPADLLDAELFGIESGVATGVQARAGRFELAHGGTLFLDEIGDMSLDTQARILRVLQEKQVYRVGSHRPLPADVRIIAATHRDLPAMVKAGSFRLDLYHRIADWRAELPPLRDRREDIAGLAALFLSRACAARGIRSGGLTQAAIDALCGYAWPGNVRELEREMSRVALFVEEGEPVSSDLFRADIRETPGQQPVGTGLAAALAEAERQVIAGTLAQCGGRVTEAARRLGISRATLYRRLEQLGMEPPASRPRES
ncbi:sigma 54-interacting transcriptional regulator [Pseudofulvimonas gallinarii]|uniref:Regulatory Fis family protein n=1 Tax=Pseudofulvimonas gallinarii TaxID=634155 RepID=A0A4R3L0P7_9GAMM|nr:sigma 54-interacting transcriptional regulator [Pseudofulvimonas gallinarii]TCS92762.1 regulatory Fis family protein [Pseudofulvimonas gallinarii]